ncbi:hypothetical protein D6833_11440, partial [Candidatus Parcubacteria bacterium]
HFQFIEELAYLAWFVAVSVLPDVFRDLFSYATEQLGVQRAPIGRLEHHPAQIKFRSLRSLAASTTTAT